MQITFKQAAPLLQSAILRDVERIGGKVSETHGGAYVQQRFHEGSRGFLTTDSLRDEVVAELRPLEWDSKIFGKSIAALSLFTRAEEKGRESKLCADLIAVVQDKAKADGIEMLVIRLGIEQLPWIQALEEKGFQVMDVQCPLVRRRILTRPDLAPDKSNLTIRLFEPGDLSVLESLAKEAFGRSHLYADPRLPAARTDHLHEEWIRNDCSGRACFVFVALKDERLAGCVAGLWDQGQEDLLGIRHGHIDLIAVKSDARRAGIARALMVEAMQWYSKARADVVTVSTQGANLAAVNLYQNLGFTLQGLQLTLHGWQGNAPN